jgi:hypothetical protein
MKKITLLLFLFTVNFILLAQKTPCNTDVNINYSKEKSDTTITLQNGAQLTFNRCEFFDIKDCLVYTEIKTVKDLQANGLTTMDSDGNLLLSCGMFKIDFNKGECTKPCLDVPVRVRVPLFNSPCASSTDRRRMYKAMPNGKWEDLKKEATIFTDVNGKQFSEFYMKCGAGINCDQKIKYTMVKFKAKKVKRLLSLNLSSNCPLINVDFETGRRKRIIFAKVPCMIADSLTIKVEAIDKEGNKMYLTKKLSDCKPKFKVSKCGPKTMKIVRNILGIFRTREREIYGKYIID